MFFQRLLVSSMFAALLAPMAFAESPQLTCAGTLASTGRPVTIATTPSGQLRKSELQVTHQKRQVVSIILGSNLQWKNITATESELWDGDRKLLLRLDRDLDPQSDFVTAHWGPESLRCFLRPTSRALVPHEAQLENSSPQDAYCEGRKDPRFFLNRLADTQNRLAFPNGPYGLLQGGICWWISRFERNAAYLAIFHPELPAPTDTQAKLLIAQIRAGRQMVQVPGFANLGEFSAKYKPEIIRSLENWQLMDGLLGFTWLRRLDGPASVEPSVLRRIFDDTFELVENRKMVVFHMLQMDGIGAHSWLVLGLKKQANGYDFMVADSNFNDIAMWVEFRDGMRQIPIYKTVPYIQPDFDQETLRENEISRQLCLTSNGFVLD